MKHPCTALFLLATAGTLHAQSVTATITALTPLTVAGTVGGQTVTASQPAGLLVPGASLLVQPFAASVHQAYVSWSTYEHESETSATLFHWLEAPTAPSVLQAGPHEFLISISATATVPGILQLQSTAWASAFAFAPLLSIDLGNDGQIDFPDISGGSGTIDLPGWVFDTQPTLVRIIASASLQGAGESFSQFTVRALPANDASVWTSAIGCATTAGISHLRVFQDRGIDFRAQSLLPHPTVLVIGLGQQPALLPANQGITCLLLPAPDIILWNPTGYYHVPLPAALRPVVFYAQGVEVAPTGLLPTDAFGVSAF